MANILVKPPQIRSTASRLREHAKSIQSSLESIEQIFTELPPDRFAGFSSGMIRSRYTQKRQYLRNIEQKTVYFAESLEKIAEKFEQADKELNNSHPTGQVLGVSTTSGIVASISAWLTYFQNLSPSEQFMVLKDLKIEIARLSALISSSRSIEEIDLDIKDLDARIADLKRLKEIAKLESDNWLNQIIPDWPLEGDQTDGAPWRVRADDFEDEIAEYDRQLSELEAQRGHLVDERNTLQSNEERLAECESEHASAKTQILAQYDGRTYAPGVGNTNAGRPVDPPLINTSELREPDLYNAVLNQFGVETNPRYTPRNGNTYCNIFVWDATKAMGAEIPHYVNSNGEPVAVGKGYELDANGVVNWLENHGENNGWRAISASEAQEFANLGKPTVAAWENSPGIGHVAMVRPGGDYSPSNGPVIAQAGGVNTNASTVSERFKEGWKNNEVLYYVHE